MKKTYIIIISILIIIAGFGLYLWRELQENHSIDNNVIKIGVILPLTGPVAEPGINALRGVELSVAKFNAEHKHQIQLILEDSKSNSKDAISAINKLITVDKVKIVIGDIMSSVVLAIAPIAERNRVLLISPGASSPDVRNAGDYIFRIYSSDDYDGQVMAKYILEKLHKTKAAIIIINNDYGIGVKNIFIKSFTALKGQVVLSEFYTQGQTDFRNIIVKIKNSNPEVLYIVGNPTENGNLVKQLKELNVNIPLTGNISFEHEGFLKVAKNSFDSVIFSAPFFNIDSDKTLVKSFVSKYSEKYGSKPDIAAALGFDTAQIISTTIDETDFNVDDLKEKLYKVKNFDGITGNMSFDSNGDVQKDIFIKRIKGDGKIDIIELFSIKSNY
ncbi:MAG: penicillin-binding protein activator [Pseudomonadota bacterium]